MIFFYASERENIVPQWAFKLNCFPAIVEVSDLNGHTPKVNIVSLVLHI